MFIFDFFFSILDISLLSLVLYFLVLLSPFLVGCFLFIYNKKLFIIFLLICLTSGGYVHYLKNSLNYNLNLISNGNRDQRANAFEYLRKNKPPESIPVLIENISSSDRVSEPKGGVAMHCAVTWALEDITNQKLGRTCTVEDLAERERIVDQWENWYENDYPEWVRNLSIE